jgi:DNA-binding protein H-NS
MLENLIQQKADIDRQIAELEATEKAEALAKVHGFIHHYGLTRDDVFPRNSLPAKYADPVSGAKWAGRGRAPTWFDQSRADEFKIAA